MGDSAIDQLAKRFEALGARYLFLRQAWRSIVADGDIACIASHMAAAAREPNAPYAGVGSALKRLKDAGATDRDLTDLVRGKQAELLFSLCYLLEDPNIEEPEGQDVLWALVQVTEAGEIVGPISGLHESVLETDPTGREMRPRGHQ
jgi:hypothetical protein